MRGKLVALGDCTQDIPLLQTKILMPRTLSGLVQRQRLNESLDRGLHGRLTLVTAPAGFGKTTAVAEWVRHSERPVAWVSLDSGENDPVRFWRYVAAAVSGLQPGVGDRLSAILRASTSPPWEAAISLLIDDLAALPFDCVLVLDDYHVLNEPVVHDTFFFLVRYAPERIHPVIVGRAEAPVSLSRLRAASQVTELTARDLSFSREEAAAFYQQRDIRLTGEEVATLADRMGGWAAGMQIAALSLQAGGNTADLIQRIGGRDRHLAGYFMDEVFCGFEEPVQEFLLQTSILRRLSGPLCDALTGREDGSSILSAVARQGGFVTCLDEKDGWYGYGYHQLFAEFLQNLLHERHRAQVPGLHKKAASWFETNGLVAEAIEHYLRGDEYDRAISLMETQAPRMLGRGQTATFFRWLEALPPGLVDRSLSLCVARAWAEVETNRIAGVEDWLARAEAICRDEDEKQSRPGGGDSLALDRALLNAYLAVKRKDVPGTIHWLTKASQTSGDAFIFAHGIMYETQEPSLLAGVLGWFGCLTEKAKGKDSGSDGMVRSFGGPAARRGYVLVANGEALYEWNDIDAAVKSLLQGMEEARAPADAGVLVSAIFTLAKVRTSRGDFAGALQVAAEGEDMVRDLGQLQWLPVLAALRTRIHVAAGNTAEVSTWVERSRLDVYDRLSTARAYEHITLARVLLARGQGEEATFFLERLLTFAKQEQHLPRTIEISNLLAMASDAAGRTSRGLDLLRENLALGHENGYLRTFVDEGARMLALLRQLTHADGGVRPESETAYVRRLIALLRQSPTVRYPRFQAPTPSNLAESLTPRELAVLMLLSAGLDNRSIAAEMSVALPTVKTHLASIYGKMGVAGRRDAVERARELGLLPARER